jgi:hypothetical protein
MNRELLLPLKALQDQTTHSPVTNGARTMYSHSEVRDRNSVDSRIWRNRSRIIDIISDVHTGAGIVGGRV